ncbi:glycoside hydrolase family 28 protein [Pedobacter psychrodurus]|uniref:Glycoside hydrolase family 28 protein n=1 Tax=Pedobacter psychrodurus TaxID=2530456 RepID=A0A4R0PYR6_9SPHI|nr:glycoside hydrolase family 28 protein [Pedobacter psychrodurus]TCD28270.1 glycoside hydrolase family 28 protein [Pedobacter psychrodurus]
MKYSINIIKALIFILTTCIGLTANAQSYYNVIKYGAKNDSSKLATTAIKNAIEAASKAGGGTVYFPAGKYLTGAIHLKSNIIILIDAGAELHFSDNFDDYLPMVKSRYEGVDVTSFSPLFYAYKVENISIIGRGIIDGHGKKWWDFVEGYKEGQPRSKWQTTFDGLNKDIILPDDPKQMKRGFLRPPFIQPMFCKNVLIDGITIRNSPFWTINPEFCENVKIHAVTINNPHSPNTDGINPESCKNVHISDCLISVGDDCITIKSGKDAPGIKMAVPAENYVITNCTMLSGHGGVVIGSEMSGDVRKIAISNCIFDGTDRGIRIKTARGRGGVVEDIRVSNIIMKNIKDQAIVLDMQYAKTNVEPVSERTPIFRNIHFSNITGQVNQAAYLNGLEEMPIDNITFNDINMDAKTGFSINNSSNIEFHNVTVNTELGPSLKALKVNNLIIDGLKSNKPNVNAAVIDLTNVSDLFLYNAFPTKETVTYLKLSGAETKNIFLGNNNFRRVREAVKKEKEVSSNIEIISGDKGQ